MKLTNIQSTIITNSRLSQLLFFKSKGLRKGSKEDQSARKRSKHYCRHLYCRRINIYTISHIPTWPVLNVLPLLPSLRVVLSLYFCPCKIKRNSTNSWNHSVPIVGSIPLYSALDTSPETISSHIRLDPNSLCLALTLFDLSSLPSLTLFFQEWGLIPFLLGDDDVFPLNISVSLQEYYWIRVYVPLA